MGKRLVSSYFLFFASLFCAVESRADFEGLPLHGFFDVKSGLDTSKEPDFGRLRGTQLGTFDLFLTPSYGKVVGLAEIVLEQDFVGKAVGIDLERGQIGYFFGDFSTLWMGRFHTPYGYWNTAYHHGAQLQTPIERPRFVNFEDKGGILPSHTVGFLDSGKWAPFEQGHFNYSLFMGNGSRITGALPGVVDFNSVNDDNGNIAFGANLGYEFTGGVLGGLQFGAHGLREEIDAYDGPNANNTMLNATMVQMVGGYIVYDENDFEFVSEYYHFMNRDLQTKGSKIQTSDAAFAFLGYSVLPYLKPYLKWEQATLNSADNYFMSQRDGVSYNRYGGGIRFDINERASLKLEINATQQKAFAGMTLTQGNPPVLTNPDGKAVSYSSYGFQYSMRF